MRRCIRSCIRCPCAHVAMCVASCEHHHGVEGGVSYAPTAPQKAQIGVSYALTAPQKAHISNVSNRSMTEKHRPQSHRVYVSHFRTAARRASRDETMSIKIKNGRSKKDNLIMKDRAEATGTGRANKPKTRNRFNRKRVRGGEASLAAANIIT